MASRVAIDEAKQEAMASAAPAVLQRHIQHGRADRRESALMTLLAGVVPLAGFLGFGWPPGTAAGLALVNLAALLLDDLVKSALAHGTLRRLHEEAIEDELVWAVGEAMLRGRSWFVSGITPTQHQQMLGFGQILLFATVSAVALALGLMQVLGPAARVSWEPLAWGSLPTLALLCGSYLAGFFAHNPHWRRSGSARLVAAQQNTFALIMIGFWAWVAAEAIHAPDGGLAEASFALLACSAVGGLGAWRLHRLARLDAVARWLGWRPRARRRRPSAR